MKHKEHLETVVATLHGDEIMLIGNPETTGNADIHERFHRDGQELGISPLQMWAVEFKQHADALIAFARNPQGHIAPITEHAVHARVHLGHLIAMIVDVQNVEKEIAAQVAAAAEAKAKQSAGAKRKAPTKKAAPRSRTKKR